MSADRHEKVRMQSSVAVEIHQRKCRSRIQRGISGTPFGNDGFVLLRRANSAATKARILPNETLSDPAQRDQLAARLADMRKVLAEDEVVAFLENARAELHDLAGHDDPWPTSLAERAIAAAMLLGFEDLEAACRATLESAGNGSGPSPRQAARAAAALLDTFRTARDS
jgi:hypothetical protein